MKLKLKVPKTLKRNLKEIAQKKSIERKDYVKEQLLELIESKRSIWESRIDTYEEFLNERDSRLIKLKESLEEDEEKTVYEKRDILKNFYYDEKIFRYVQNKNRKLENIIIDLKDNEYYAIQILADDQEEAIESYVVNFLHHIK